MRVYLWGIDLFIILARIGIFSCEGILKEEVAAPLYCSSTTSGYPTAPEEVLV